ncbi:MAG: endospore germination permease [Firmicutes bacterium]|nr:endospore germination permease [Bacillota bacterium]
MASRGDRNHIKNAQFAVLTAQTVFSTGFLAVGGLFATISESGAWLGTLLGALGGLAVAGLCSLVVQMHPGKNLSGIADAVLPKAISKLVSLSYAAYCVWLLAAGTRQFILAIWIPFLQTASPLTLAILVAAVTLYGANLGIEAIARASIVFFPVVVLSILVLAGLSVPVAAPGRLLPAVGVGVPELLRTSLLASSFGAECIVMMAFVAHTNEPEGVGRAVAWGVLVGMVMMAAVVAIDTVVLGSRAVTRVIFPVLEVAKLVGFGEFLERSEVLLLSVWFCAALLKQATVFHASARSIADTLGLKNPKLALVPLGASLVVASLYPTTVVAVLEWVRAFLRYTIWYALGLPLALLVASMLRRPERAHQGEGRSR